MTPLGTRTGHFRSSALLALAVGSVLFLTADTRASILGGDFAIQPADTFCVNQLEETYALLAGASHDAAPEAGAPSETTTPPAPLEEENNDDSQENRFLHQGSGTAGSSTSSTSSVGASGAGGSALLTAAAVQLADDSPARRFAFEQTLSLPAPPGTELLRPPQVAL